MLNLLISKIGEKTYLEAVSRLARTADEPKGTDMPSPDFIHDIDGMMAELGFADAEVWEIWNELILQLPCYGTWMYVFMHYQHRVEEPERRLFLTKLAGLLDNSAEAIAAALEYSLWVDFFENPETVSFAWLALQNDLCTEKGRLRLLGVSGPVPFELKKDFLHSFLGDERMHKHILAALYASLYEVYGKSDPEGIKELLAQLRIDKSDDIYEAVTRKLP